MADASVPSPAPQLIELGVTPSLADYTRSLWRRREFAWSTARGELQTQHLDTVLGSAWHLINPLLLIGVYFLVFGVVLETDRGLGEQFLPFLAIGVFHYQFSQKSIIGGAKTITNNQGLIRSLQFPRALLPIATVLREAMAFVPVLGVMLLIVLLNGQTIRWTWLLLMPLVALQLVFNLGATFISARLTDKFRDLENLLPYLFRLGFYGSGVIFAIDAYITNELILAWLTLNPFYSILSLVRDQLLDGYSPAFAGLMWWSVAGWALVSSVVGLLVFRAGEREYGRG